MDKKYLLVAAVIAVVGYFWWKKNKSTDKNEEVEDKFQPAERDFRPAEEYEEATVVTTGLTAEERQNLTPEEQAALEEQREQQLQLDLIRREYKNLSGKNLKAYTVDAAQAELDDLKVRLAKLDEYIALTADQNANIKDERYDELSEIDALIAAAHKAQEYVDLGGSYAETRGKTAQEIDELIKAMQNAKIYVKLGGNYNDTVGKTSAEIDDLITARRTQLELKWDADRTYIEGIKNKFNTYLIKDITYKNKDENIKPLKEFLTKCTNRDRAYFVASINNGANVKIKYDSKQHTFKTLAEAIKKMFDNKTFGTHKKAAAFLQSVLSYANEFNGITINDFDKYGNLKN